MHNNKKKQVIRIILNLACLHTIHVYQEHYTNFILQIYFIFWGY